MRAYDGAGPLAVTSNQPRQGRQINAALEAQQCTHHAGIPTGESRGDTELFRARSHALGDLREYLEEHSIDGLPLLQVVRLLYDLELVLGGALTESTTMRIT